MKDLELLKVASPSTVVEVSNKISSMYLNPGAEFEVNISDAMKKTLHQMIISDRIVFSELNKLIEIAQHEIIAILAMNGFPRYIASSDYTEWRRDETAHAKTFRQLLPLESTDYETDPVAADNSRRLINKAMTSFDTKDVFIISLHESWFKYFISCAELLPVSVSIATADQGRRGFPLVYTNPEFERMTGYSRHGIMGKNCKFLQSSKTEREGLLIMSAALRDSALVKIDVTNFKKDGSFFRNFVTMKPILDQNGVVRYVVCIQHDITGEGISLTRGRFADKLLQCIPDVMIIPI